MIYQWPEDVSKLLVHAINDCTLTGYNGLGDAMFMYFRESIKFGGTAPLG